MKLQTVLSKRKLLTFTAFPGTLSRIFESEALEVLHLAKRRSLQMSWWKKRTDSTLKRSNLHANNCNRLRSLSRLAANCVHLYNSSALNTYTQQKWKSLTRWIDKISNHILFMLAKSYYYRVSLCNPPLTSFSKKLSTYSIAKLLCHI